MGKKLGIEVKTDLKERKWTWNEVTISGRPTNCQTGSKSHFYTEADQLGSVENLVLEHYGKDGWEGSHCEGSLLRCLFGLFFAKVMFTTPVPRVFQHLCQDAPLDFGTPCF